MAEVADELVKLNTRVAQLLAGVQISKNLMDSVSPNAIQVAEDAEQVAVDRAVIEAAKAVIEASETVVLAAEASALDARDAALTAAEVSGEVDIVATFEEASAKLGSYPNLQIVRVLKDGTRENRQSFYRKEGGVLVHKAFDFVYELINTKAEAEAGLLNQGRMTPLRTKESINALVPKVPVSNLMAPSYQMLLSDILNMEPVSILRFIDRDIHQNIRDGIDNTNLVSHFNEAGVAFTENGGGRLYMPSGLYNLDTSSPVFRTGNIEIGGDGPGRTILLQKGTGAQVGLQILKSNTEDFSNSLTYYNLSTAFDIGTKTITLSNINDAVNLEEGYAWIKCRELISIGNNEPVAELVEITHIDYGTGVITLKWGTKKPYAPDTTGTIRIFGIAQAINNGAPLENIHVHHLSIHAPNAAYPLWIRHGYNVRIHDIQTKGRIGPVCSAGATQVDFYSNDVQIENPYPDFPYFFAIDKGASDIHVHHSTFRSTGAGSLHIHEGVANATVNLNTFMCGETDTAHSIDWPVISIAGSSWNTTIADNKITNSPSAGIRASNSYKYGAAPYNEVQHPNLKVLNNILLGKFGGSVKSVGAGDWAIIFDGQVSGYRLEGNIVDAITPVTGGAIKTTGPGKVKDNTYRGLMTVPNVTGMDKSGNVPIDDLTYADFTRLVGGNGATGLIMEGLVTGQTSPRLFMGNREAALWTAIYGNGSVIDFTTGAVPGASTGTTRLRVSASGIAVTGYVAKSSATGLTATGTNLATALSLVNSVNHITTAAAGTGVYIPSVAAVGAGAELVLINDAANPIKIYAQGVETIDGIAGGTGITLAAGAKVKLVAVATGIWKTI